MKIRVLGCSGAIAQGCRTTSFLIGTRILIDAGTGVGDLTLDEMAAIDYVLLTHSHLDHIASLPLMIDAVASRRSAPLQVHALPETIAALRTHIFNDVIWPDFSRIPSSSTPFLVFSPLAVGQTLQLANTAIEVLPAAHTVPAVGYAVKGTSGWWVFSGDTAGHPAFWKRVNALPVAMLVIETAFSNREHALAELSQHLSSDTLALELAQFAGAGACPIFITHTKPSETALIYEEVCRFDAHAAGGGPARHDIRWLEAGQVLEV
jgi:glyoxylase-like metal-dependent hydrolase (beta-lactamase superfamily II)